VIISAPTDYRNEAKKKLPPFLFHYIDGGSYSEHTLTRNTGDLADIALKQRVLNDMSELDLSIDLFNEKMDLRHSIYYVYSFGVSY